MSPVGGRGGGIADMVHASGRKTGRFPCLGIYSFGANLRSVSHANKIMVGPSLPILL